MKADVNRWVIVAQVIEERMESNGKPPSPPRLSHANRTAFTMLSARFYDIMMVVDPNSRQPINLLPPLSHAEQEAVLKLAAAIDEGDVTEDQLRPLWLRSPAGDLFFITATSVEWVAHVAADIKLKRRGN